MGTLNIDPNLRFGVEIKNRTHLILLAQLASIPTQSLGAVISTADRARGDIIRAVNILATGFLRSTSTTPPA